MSGMEVLAVNVYTRLRRDQEDTHCRRASARIRLSSIMTLRLHTTLPRDARDLHGPSGFVAIVKQEAFDVLGSFFLISK
jgi:hypothetical protein